MRITRLERLTSSVNGNPRYRVGFDDGLSAITSSDAAFCYGITNPEMRGEVVVKYTRAGRIADISPAIVVGSRVRDAFAPGFAAGTVTVDHGNGVMRVQWDGKRRDPDDRRRFIDDVTDIGAIRLRVVGN